MPARSDKSFRFLQELAEDLSRPEIAFPTFSDATLRVRSALNNPLHSAAQLAAVVSGEPLLAARLIKVANAVAFNRGGAQVADVKSAVVRVGATTVRSVATAVAVDQLLQSSDLQPHRKRTEAIWQHSIDVAMLAYVIARGISRVNPDEALLAGLLQDIGQFYLLSRVKGYPEVANDPQELDALLDEWHVGIGCSILVSMDLPAATIHAVERHHSGHPPSPLVTPLRDLAEVLAVANGAAMHFSSREGVGAVHGDPGLPPVDPAVLQILVASVDELKALAAEMRG